MSDQVRREVYLDALALVEAHHRDDEEGFNAVLAATDNCPWYLAQLVNALADLGVLALQGHPEGTVDWFLAEVRRCVLERS